MTALFLLFLVTIVGLFFIYQIFAADQSRSSEKKNVLSLGERFSIAIDAFEQRLLKSSESFINKKPLLKVEPILSLKEYYSKESRDTPSEIDLTKKEVLPVYLRKAESIDPYADLKIRFDELKTAYQKLEHLSYDRMMKLDQTQRKLEAELTLRQDFDRVKSRLEQQIIDIYKEMIEKDRIIESLQNSPVNRVSSQLSAAFPESTREQELSKDFVKLPADLMSEDKKFSNKDLSQGGQNRLLESLEDQNINLLYRMPSEDEIIRSLKNKKYPL